MKHVFNTNECFGMYQYMGDNMCKQLYKNLLSIHDMSLILLNVEKLSSYECHDLLYFYYYTKNHEYSFISNSLVKGLLHDLLCQNYIKKIITTSGPMHDKTHFRIIDCWNDKIVKYLNNI